MRRRNRATNEVEIVEIKSLPDFEGAIHPHGRQIIFEAKVCSQPSYKWEIDGSSTKRKQIDHLIARARVGALAFLLLHFNGRTLKTRTDKAFTVAIRIHPDREYVRDLMSHGSRSISRAEAQMYAVTVPWNTFSKRGTKLTPDLSVLLRDHECDDFHPKVQ